ncbi:MAG: DMT family transporter [Acidimicrobiales bacterium]|nr:DMT family transporter [Acidimicrobiales bacterium]
MHAPVPADHHLLSTSPGTNTGTFGSVEWGLLVATALMWGTAYLLIAIGLESLPPGGVTFLRMVIGAATLSLFPATRRVRIDREDWPRVAALGVLWLALPLTLFPIAQQWITSAAAGMITGAQPVFVAVLASILLRRRPGTRQLQGIAIGFVGVLLIALPAADEGRSSAIGVVLVLVAVVSYAIAATVAVPLQQRYGSLPVIWRALLVAAVLVTPWGLISLPGAHPTAASLAAVVPLGVLSTGIGYVCFTTLAGRAGATRGSVAVYLIPVVAIVAGVLGGGDRIPAIALPGTALVLVGAWLTSRAEA